ncbi:MAG: SDR family oxidoreductase [Ignavibacteriaceae bacterium]|jgi:3-oxoacyl-[acyl-carrier protein] reductase
MKNIILITGTSKGIGKELAQYYLSKDYYVIGCSRGKLELENKNYTHYSLDVSNENDVKQLFKEIRNKFGKVDILINNAGIAAMNHSLLTPLKTINLLLNTNFIGTFLFCREAAKLMKSKKFGRIINFTTVAVPLKLEGEAVYAASKSAINTLTQILAFEFAEFGITVNAIGPTPIKTDLIKNVPEEKIKKILNRQAIKRFGEFIDIINLIDFFIKPESNFITGQIIYLGGIS